MNIRNLSILIMLGILISGSDLPQGKSQDTPSQYKVPNEDMEAIRQTALDYGEAWYGGDAKRMEGCLHPDLVVRTIRDNQIETETAKEMILYTQQGVGMGYVGKKEFTVTILDVYHDISDVKIVSPQYIDYLQIGKINGKWLIINALWIKRQE